MARKNGILTPEEALEALGIQTAAGKPAAAPALTVTPGNALKSRAAAIITGSGGQTKGRGVTTRYGAAGHTAPLPAPSGRNELEIARSESRQLRQLGAGVSPETLAQREQTRQNRTYLPRAGERQPMSVTPSYEGMKQDIGMLMDRLEEQRAPLKEHLAALRKSTSDEWASMTAVQAETRRQTIGEIQDQIAALDRQEQQWMDEFYAAMDMEDKLDRGKYLAGLDRPLSDWEREEAKALAKELQTKPMEAVGAQLGGDTAAMRDQTQRNALASRLLSRSSASGAFGSGFVESFPGARRALEDGQEAIRESGAYRQIFNDPEIAALMERGSAFEDAPEVSGGAYMAGMGAGDLSQIVTLNNLFGAGVRAVKPLSKLPGAVQNALTSGLTFGTKDAADVAGAGGSLEEIAKAGAVSFAGGAVGSGMADLVKLGGGRILTRYGAQNSIPLNILRDALSGTAFAGGSMGTRMALDEEYRPSGEEAAKDLAVSFAFSTLTSLLGTYGRTQADKARLQQYGEAMKQDYAAIVGGGNRQMTLDALDDLAAKSAQIRAELRNGTYLGQQKTVNGMLELLDALDDAVEKGRTQIYGSGLGAGASTHRMDALPGGAAGAALGSASDLATPPPASGPAMLPTAAELNSGTVGGLAAMANSQALGNLPRAGEVDRGTAGPYDGGKEADILEGGLRDGRESMGRADRGGETGAVLRFETRFPGAGRETAAEGTPGAGGEAEGTGKISPFGGEILRGKELGGNDNRRTGGEVLWRSLQGTQPGGQGSYGNADRRPDEGTGGTERTEKAGGVIYTYRETPPERYSAGTLAALAEYRAFGLTPKVVDSFRRTVGSRTIESTDAVTGPDGTVYLLNDGTIPAKENAAHEALHVALRRELPSAVVYTGLVRDNIDLNDDTVQMYLSSIVAQYFDKHGRPFDSKDGMDELFEEFAAFMSGTMHDGSARDKFGAAIDDFDALEAAWLQMKQEMGAASAEPEYLPRAGEERETGLLPQAGQESGFSDVDRLSGGYINRTVPPEEVLQGIQDAAKLLPEPESAVDGYWDSLLDEIERRAPAPQPGSEADADGYWDALLDWVTEQTEGFKPKTAEVSAERTPTELTAGEKAAEAWGYFKRKMVDAGDSVTRVGKVTGDKALYPYYNFARASTNAAEAMIAPGGAQTDIMGRKVGPSVADLWEPIRQKGEDYYISFQDYLFHRHNIDRMSREDPMAASDAEQRRQTFTETHPEIAYQTEDRLRRIVEEDGPDAVDAWEYLQLVREVNRAENRKNKPVFGWEVDADKSRDAVAVYEREHPEFKALAEQVYQFSRNLMQYRVDSGLLSREQADIIEAAYPHYVPAFRETARPANARNAKGVRVGRTVGRAEGGNANLMPLHIAMARQTMQVVREGAKNRFGMRLLDNAFGHEEKLKSLIRSTQEYEREVSPDSFDLPDDPTPQKTNTFTVYRDGKAWVMELDPGLYEGVKALSPEGGDGNVAVRAVRAANDLFKRLVTGYNPMFMARNFARDLQDAGLYSKDLGAWAQNYPLAVKEIISDGPFWRQYKALGGTYSSVFDYERGYRADRERGAVRRNTVDRVEALNMGIEQAPRLAEFMATVKKGGGDLDNLMEAMHNAAEVTVNFGRAGTLGKKLNQNFVPFLNPGIQGFDKMVRRLAGKKSGGEWAKLIIRCIALGVAPMVLNALLYRDDPEWEDIRDSDKDVNYLIKVGEGRWLKIPKGRDLSVLGMLTDRVGDTVRGEDVDWGDTLRTAANQIAPANPLENNIIAAWADADLFDAGSPGKTWYGGDIESQRLQGYAPGERYDERTDVFSKWLGGVLNLSPKKINYILDQYTGVVGDFVLPLLTPQAEQNPFEKSFVLDSVSSNKISGEFYDTGDSITFAKNGGDAPMSVVSRFWNRQSKAVSDIYGQIREIENSTELSDAEKREQVREAKGILNGIQKNAMEVLPAYEEAVRKHFTGDSDEEMDEAYLQANREVFGAEYALQVYNKQVYERAVSCDRQGVDFGDYFDVYFAMKDLETTNEKRDVLASADLTDEQKRVLYRDRITKDRDDDILASVVAGLPFNDFLEAQNVYSTLDKREGLSASERRTEFVRWMDGQLFTAGQREMLLEAFRFATWNPAQKTTYEKLMENGLDSAQAYAAAGGILGLEPLEGKSQVSAIQKGRVIVDGQGSDEQKVAALAAVLGDTEYAKLETAYQYDVSPEAYISYREALLEADDGNGSITQDEAKAAIDRLPLSTAQKAALWQLQNTSWKYWKNPYSGSVGRAVLDAYRNRPAGEAPQIQTRYGDGGPGGTGSGQVQTRYGGVSPVMDRGQIQTRYGGAGSTAQVAQKGSTLYQKVEMLPTAKDFIG